MNSELKLWRLQYYGVCGKYWWYTGQIHQNTLLIFLYAGNNKKESSFKEVKHGESLSSLKSVF